MKEITVIVIEEPIHNKDRFIPNLGEEFDELENKKAEKEFCEKYDISFEEDDTTLYDLHVYERQARIIIPDTETESHALLRSVQVHINSSEGDCLDSYYIQENEIIKSAQGSNDEETRAMNLAINYIFIYAPHSYAVKIIGGKKSQLGEVEIKESRDGWYTKYILNDEVIYTE